MASLLPLPFTAWEITSMSSTLSIVLLSGRLKSSCLPRWWMGWVIQCGVSQGHSELQKGRPDNVNVCACVCLCSGNQANCHKSAGGQSWWSVMVALHSSFPSHVITYKKPLTGHSGGIRLAYWAHICLDLCWKLLSPFIHMIRCCRWGRLPVAFVAEMQRTAAPKVMHPIFYSVLLTVSFCSI